MSKAHDCLKAGDLAGALRELQVDVRQKPADASLRVFLVELLVAMGQWDRALKQLTVLHEMDASALPMVHTCRSAIQCEALRKDVFAGVRTPVVLGEPPAWTALLIQALADDAAGQAASASRLRAEALEAASPVSGRINDQPFEWLADADPRLGPILEVILDGRYLWVPVERIRKIRITPPENLRDLVWLPAQFTWDNEGETVGLIPTRYPGTESLEDDALRLGRRTDWLEAADGSVTGVGQRLLVTDADEYSLLDVREILFDVAS